MIFVAIPFKLQQFKHCERHRYTKSKIESKAESKRWRMSESLSVCFGIVPPVHLHGFVVELFIAITTENLMFLLVFTLIFFLFYSKLLRMEAECSLFCRLCLNKRFLAQANKQMKKRRTKNNTQFYDICRTKIL